MVAMFYIQCYAIADKCIKLVSGSLLYGCGGYSEYEHIQTDWSIKQLKHKWPAF